MLPSHPGSVRLANRRAACRRRLHRGAHGISTLLRISVAGLLIGIVASVIVWGLSETAPYAQSAEPEQYTVVTVQPGDTLWQIAATEYDESLDLRAVVYEIGEANDLSDALLQPGQEITLPYVEP